MTDQQTPLHAALRSYFAQNCPDHIAVAVSGGSDSLALLSLCQAWHAEGGPRLSAVTVNHGLRAEAADEAAMVAKLCADWQVPHTCLTWARQETSGNLHDQARRARYAMMAEWASAKRISFIALGHTQDDQAETFMMRLARGAGVDGLAAMRSSWIQDGITFARPLLGCRREALRDHLREQNLTWVEDAANSDPKYDRSRVRAALPDLGISIETLAEVAGHLAQAKDALQIATIEAGRRIACTQAGDVVINREGFEALPQEIARRLLLSAMHWITGHDYPPRGEALTALISDVHARRNATLQGCDVSHSESDIRITREAGALADVISAPETLWDGRWRLTGPVTDGVHIARLGEGGLPHCPDRALAALPARSLIATPAVWQADRLIAAPLAGLANGWTATLVPRKSGDFAAQIAH